MPDTPKPKSAAQLQVEALNRKRKPLITFETKDIEILKKQHAAEIEAINRQLSGLQEDNKLKEARIQELEDQIAALQKPADKGPPVALTEAAPGQPGARQSRRAAAAKPAETVITNDPKDKEIKAAIEANPEVLTNIIKENAPAVAAIVGTTEPPKTPPAAAPAKPVKPGDGIEEDD